MPFTQIYKIEIILFLEQQLLIFICATKNTKRHIFLRKVIMKGYFFVKGQGRGWGSWQEGP